MTVELNISCACGATMNVKGATDGDLVYSRGVWERLHKGHSRKVEVKS